MSITIIEAPTIDTPNTIYTVPYARTMDYAYVPKAVFDNMGLDALAAAFAVDSKNVRIVKDFWLEDVCIVYKPRIFPRGPVRDMKPLSIDGGACMIFPGQTVVAAPADSGKTPTGYHICDSLNGVLIHWGEPFPGSPSEELELGFMILKAISSHDVIVIDSYKDLARNAGGTTMSDGLSSLFFTLMSVWSGHYSSFGKYLVSPVNFATENSAAIASAVASLHSNSSSVIWTEGPGQVWKWKGRPGIGQVRSSGEFNINWGNTKIDRLVAVGDVSNKGVKEKFYDLGSYVRNNPDALTRAAKSSFTTRQQ